MPNGMDKKRGKRPVARHNERRGTMYDRIADARAKRQQVLSGEAEAPARIPSRNTVAALRGASVPPPEVPDKPQATAEPSPESPSEPPTPWFEDDPNTQTAPEGEAAIKTAVAPARSGAAMWVVSLTIAALTVGSVIWLSRPASRPADQSSVSVVADTPTTPTPIVVAPLETPPTVAAILPSAPIPPEWSAMPEVARTALLWSPPITDASAPSAPPLQSAERLPEFGGAPVSVATGPRPQPRPVTPTLADDDTTAEPVLAEATETPEAAPVGRDLRVVLNAPRTVPDASLAAVIEALEQSGAEPDPRRVNLTISTSNVRYYHAADADAATVIADGIGAQLRDFTDFEPSPPEGLVEIWMAGREIATGSPQGEAPLDQLAQELRQLQEDLTRALRGN